MSDAANIEAHDPVASALQEMADSLEKIHLHQRIATLGPDRIHDLVYDDQLIRFHLPMAHVDMIQQHILKTNRFYEQWMLEQVRKLLVPNSVVIDAGANIGNHTLYFARVCGSSAVYAFEPMKYTFSILKRNVEINQASQVRCMNVALGARETMAALTKYSSANMGAATLVFDDRGSYEVTTLDSLSIGNVDLVKIDVEGTQLEVIAGAARLLQNQRPMLWIECRTRPPHDEFPAVNERLTALGYRMRASLDHANFIFSAR